jgi:hypothetical protein
MRRQFYYLIIARNVPLMIKSKPILMTRAASIALLIVTLCSCANLGHIVEYAGKSAATMADASVSSGLPASVQRRKDLRGGADVSLAAATLNGKRLAGHQRILSSYMSSIGALAAKDLVDYKNQFDAFEKSLSSTELVTAGESGIIRKVAEAATNLAIDVYRRKTLGELIRATDPPLRRILKNMSEVTDGYKRSLRREQVELDSAIQEMEGATEDRVVYLLNDLRSRRMAILQGELAKADAFKAALKAMAEGHQALVKDSYQLNGKEVAEIVQMHSKQIEAAYKALTTTN